MMGDSKVAFYLAIAQKDGRFSRDLKPNWEDSTRWLTEAIKGSHPTAEGFLGIAYALGRGWS
jgi:hypothetical protein